MNISLKNQEFINSCKNLSVGDSVGNLTVVKVFSRRGDYEERLSPKVLYRKTFEQGVLFKKEKSNTFVFVPTELIPSN